MLGLVVFGSRTWMCTMAAPALAASIEDLAICSGVTGTAGLRPGVSAEPVTAHEIMTLRCMLPPLGPDGHDFDPTLQRGAGESPGEGKAHRARRLMLWPLSHVDV